ncbi:hypothetical protein SBRCBS47491_009622 [Sporothrix bragantina]|uniref:Uncharacterized protein n=1 Tax=Sporothrix bragantina TaxID=671064 RepID=A0ABP0CW86_9PEZI
MSKPSFLDDVTTGFQGIRGAGDALRGELLASIDRTFDNNPSHPTTAAATTKNSGIAEQGRAAMGRADEMIARHEQAHRDKKAQKAQNAQQVQAAQEAQTAQTAGEAFGGRGAQTGAAPVATHETSGDAYTGTTTGSYAEGVPDGYGGRVDGNAAGRP